MRKIIIISLFPEVFKTYLEVGMMYKATADRLIDFELINLRDFGLGKRQQVDDTPYGGGQGMILMVEPLVKAIEYAKSQSRTNAQVVLMTPRGELFNQVQASQLASLEVDLIFIGGRYEGYDERIISWVDLQLSLGSFIVTGFELPALVVIDALVRLIPGVLGNPKSSLDDSFAHGGQVVEYPQYTKPEVFQNLAVPSILLSGHHARIEAWRKEQQQ